MRTATVIKRKQGPKTLFSIESYRMTLPECGNLTQVLKASA